MTVESQLASRPTRHCQPTQRLRSDACAGSLDVPKAGTRQRPRLNGSVASQQQHGWNNRRRRDGGRFQGDEPADPRCFA